MGLRLGLRASCKTPFCGSFFSFNLNILALQSIKLFILTTLEVWSHIQRRLFPVLQEEVGELTETDDQFVQVVGLLPLGSFWSLTDGAEWAVHPRPGPGWSTLTLPKRSISFPPRGSCWTCSKPARRCDASVAGKAPATFLPNRPSLAPSLLLAPVNLPQKLHEALVKKHLGTKLVGHVSRDATAIDAREKPTPKPPTPPAAPKKRGRPAKGQERPPAPPRACPCNPLAAWLKIWPICPEAARWVANATAKATKKPGLAISCIWIPWTETFPSAPF